MKCRECDEEHEPDDPCILYLSAEAFDALMRELEKPPEDLPALRKLMEMEPPPWKV